MKKLFLLLFFILSLQALEINYDHFKYENFKLEYFKDKTNSLTIKQIKKSNFKTINSQNSFSGSVGSVWYRINFKNVSSKTKELFLHDNFAYFSKKIEIYEFSNNTIEDKNQYNILSDAGTNKLAGSTLVYSFKVLPKQVKTLYIKNISMVTSIVNFSIYDQKENLNALLNKTFYSNIIIIILITLGLYNLMLFIYNKRREFLYYALYLFNASIGFIYMYGTLYNNFFIYGKLTYWFNITAILVSLFLVLFIEHTFDTKNSYKNIHKLLNFIIYAVLINILSAFVIDLTFAIELLKVVFTLSFIVLVYFSYILIKTSHPLAKLFIVAYFIYIFGMIITLSSMSNIIPLNFFTFHASGFTLVIEAIIFSYLMNYHVEILEQKVQEQREVIISKNKKAQLGGMINAITHQWKQPLARTTSITSFLEFKLELEGSIHKEELEDKLAQINSNIFFLSSTIDDFKNFFNHNTKKELVDVKAIINKALTFSKDDTLTKEIVIKTDLNFSQNINTYKNELLHVILNILQNSKEAFASSSETTKMIKIFGETINNKVHIDFTDNAGGIAAEDFPFIFDEHYTTKKSDTGSGIGLYLTQKIIQEHLDGSIEAVNIDNGTIFRIII